MGSRTSLIDSSKILQCPFKLRSNAPIKSSKLILVRSHSNKTNQDRFIENPSTFFRLLSTFLPVESATPKTQKKTLGIPAEKPTKAVTSLSYLDDVDVISWLALSTVGFLALASDLHFWHVLQPIDQSIHRAVISHIPVEFRQNIARNILSNGPIIFGWLCAFGCATLLLIAQQHQKTDNNTDTDEDLQRAWRHLSISVFIYIFAGPIGVYTHGDPWLLDVLKNYFKRSRPSEFISTTYSFPSAHTATATFVIGVLLFLVLPSVVSAIAVSSGNSIRIARTTTTTTKTTTTPITMLNRTTKLAIWAAAALTTASGRVLADVHWVTDVMGGACVGVALVAATAGLCFLVDEIMSGSA